MLSYHAIKRLNWIGNLLKTCLNLKTFILLFAIFPNPGLAGPGDVPEQVASVVLNRHLAEMLSTECNSFAVNERVSRKLLRAALNKEEDMPYSDNGYSVLERRLGDIFLLGARRAYSKQMEIYPFDRASACRAGEKAVEDEQPVGRYLRRVR